MAEYSLSAVLKLRDNFSATVTNFRKKTDEIGSAVAKADKQMFKLGSSAIQMGKRMMQGIGVATAAATALAFKGAADMETHMGQLETAFKGNKEMAQDYFMWANRMANATPFENAEVIEATTKLSAYGMEAKKTFKIVGDMAAANGKTLSQSVEAIADARRGELERMKEFSITKENILQYGREIGFNDLVDNKGTIKDTGKFFDVMMKLIESRTEGGMERLTKTFKGQWSTILGQTKFTLARFAGMNENGTVRAGSAFERLKNVAEGVIKKINSSLDDGSVDRWIEKLDKGVADASVYLNNLWEDIKNITGDDLTKWADSVKSAMSSLGVVLNALASSVKFIADNFGWLKYVAAFAGGAKIGGIAGSVVPGLGTGLGALAGGVTAASMMALNDAKNSDEVFNQQKQSQQTTSHGYLTAPKLAPTININITGDNKFDTKLNISDYARALADEVAARL